MIEPDGAGVRPDVARIEKLACSWPKIAESWRLRNGILAQLVERLNGIEEVRGSNPLGSTPLLAGRGSGSSLFASKPPSRNTRPVLLPELFAAHHLLAHASLSKRGMVSKLRTRGPRARAPRRPEPLCLSGVAVVGLAGFEPAASSSRTKRSTKLSHSPFFPILPEKAGRSK